MSPHTRASEKKIADLIRSEKLFAILRGVQRDQLVNTARALRRGGIKLLEVTFNHDDPHGNEETLEGLKRIRDALSDDIVLGAGTVLTVDQVRRAADAGAQFIVSPNIDHSVIRATKDLAMVSLPGALTPTEIVQAQHSGADMVKLFPGGCFGPGYVKAIRGPLDGIPLIVIGGVGLENILQFFEAGAVGVGLGSNLVSSREANRGNFLEIENKARAFVKKIQVSKELNHRKVKG